MADKDDTPANQDNAFEQFKRLTAKLVKVPKSEADAKEAVYQRK
jgi:hypothetical protein